MVLSLLCLIFYYRKNHPILIPSRLFFATSRFSWSYLYDGLKPDGLGLKPDGLEKGAPLYTSSCYSLKDKGKAWRKITG